MGDQGTGQRSANRSIYLYGEPESHEFSGSRCTEFPRQGTCSWRTSRWIFFPGFLLKSFVSFCEYEILHLLISFDHIDQVVIDRLFGQQSSPPPGRVSIWPRSMKTTWKKDSHGQGKLCHLRGTFLDRTKLSLFGGSTVDLEKNQKGNSDNIFFLCCDVLRTGDLSC